MNYPPNTWVGIVATRCEGCALAWLNAILMGIDAGHRTGFSQWEEFYEEMVKNFELVIEHETVKRQVSSLRQWVDLHPMYGNLESFSSHCPP